jgi:hypothetical protein
VVLHAERNVPEGGRGHLVVGDGLVVRAHRGAGADHHAGSTEVHHAPREFSHRREARRGDAHDDGHLAAHAGEHALHVVLALAGGELGGLAHDAEHREARGALVEVEIGEAVGALEVEGAVVPEGRHRDEVDAAGGFVEAGHGIARVAVGKRDSLAKALEPHHKARVHSLSIILSIIHHDR